MATRTE